VIWHYYGCVKVVTFGVVMQAVLEDGVSGSWSERDAIGFAECDEYCSSRLLVVREHALVFVFSFESLFGHCGTTSQGQKQKAKGKRQKQEQRQKQKAKSKASDKSVRVTHTSTAPTRALPCTRALQGIRRLSVMNELSRVGGKRWDSTNLTLLRFCRRRLEAIARQRPQEV